MGLFFKKKSKDSNTPPLSEEQIHRKLYGEFESKTAPAIMSDREHLKDPTVSITPGEGAGMDHDLFSVSSEPLIEPETLRRPVHPEIKSPEGASRHVPLHEFEKNIPPATSEGAYTRFRSNRADENKQRGIVHAGRAILEQGRKFMDDLTDPARTAVRRVLYWATAVLVVFILFWGVNALNSQREVAMNTKYKSHRSLSAAAVSTPPVAKETTASLKPVVAERSVAITPVPVRSREREVIITPAAPVKRKAAGADAARPYVIQVATYASQIDAEQVLNVLKREQPNIFVKEYKRPSGRVFYAVFIGGFRTETEAQAQLVKFRAKGVARPFQDAFVKTI